MGRTVIRPGHVDEARSRPDSTTRPREGALGGPKWRRTTKANPDRAGARNDCRRRNRVGRARARPQHHHADRGRARAGAERCADGRVRLEPLRRSQAALTDRVDSREPRSRGNRAHLLDPDAFIDDSEFPVWDSVRSEVAKAIALTLDAAVLYGTGAPSSYPTGARRPRRCGANGADALEAIDKCGEPIEATGLTRTASPPARASGRRCAPRIASPRAAVARRRAERLRDAGHADGGVGSSKGDALVGDWSKLLVGIREDIRFESERRRR